MTDALVRIKGHYQSGRTWGFGLHVSTSDSAATIQANMVSWITSFWTDGTHGVQTLFPTTTVLDSLDVTALNSVLRFQSRAPGSTLTLAGTDSTAGMADEVSAVISWRTANVGKGQTGRTKLPAPATDQISSGELASTASLRIGTAARALLALMNAAGTTLFFFNPYPTISSPVALTRRTITTGEGSNKLGTVRTRTKPVRATYS